MIILVLVNQRQVMAINNDHYTVNTTKILCKRRSLYSIMWLNTCHKNELTRILPQQQQFQKHDKVNNTVLLFVLVLDKGYSITALARQYEQNCRQPIFAKSDEQFQRNDLLLSAGIAVIRSGNERGVKYMKHSWIVQEESSMEILTWQQLMIFGLHGVLK